MSTRVKTAFVIVLLAGSVWAAESVRIDGQQFDFGLVPENATVAHQIWIHGDDTDTLCLVDVKTGCGCTTTPWTVDTILPGDSLSLVFYWHTRASGEAKSRSAYLYLEPYAFPAEIVLSGNVVTSGQFPASVTWRPAVIRLSGRAKDRLDGAYELTNGTAEALALRLVEIGPDIATEAPDTLGAGQTMVGSVRLDLTDSLAAYEGSLTLELSGNQTESFRVSIPVIFGDFSFRPLFTTKQK